MTARRVAIVQSSYLPWKGYFDLIDSADVFVLLDSVQYTRRDWRNRNRIKTAQGVRWISVPVEVSGRYHQRISDVRIADSTWARRHLEALRHAYARAPYGASVLDLLKPLFAAAETVRSLSSVNRMLTEAMCGALGIDTPLLADTDVLPIDALDGADPTGRLLRIVQALRAGVYVSGPSAQAYLDRAQFAEAGIAVEWMDYSWYPQYPQLHGDFVHEVSVVDVLAHTGSSAPSFVRRSLAGAGPRGR